jgi:hypothetical protein
MIADKRWFAWFTAGEMGFYLAQKVARGDFHYWFPIDGAFGIFMSLLMRIIVKTIADYTGIVQFRGSAELGGIYWSMNMILAAVVSPFAVLIIYYARTKLADRVMEEKSAWRIVCSLSGAWLVVFVLFLTLIKKEYRKTFHSWETGFEWARKFFLKGETDEIKAAVLGCNRKQWTAIEGNVKVWVLENWEGWEEETPGWFTEVFKASVDDDWLSETEMSRQKAAGGGVRRRSTLGGLTRRRVSSRRSATVVVPVNEEDVAAESPPFRLATLIENDMDPITELDFFSEQVVGELVSEEGQDEGVGLREGSRDREKEEKPEKKESPAQEKEKEESTN